MLRVAAFATALVAVSVAAAAPRPLVTTRLSVAALAQDGSRIAWMSGGCYTVRIRSLAMRRTAIAGNADATACYSVERPLLALAGRRALWVVSEAGNNIYADVVTGTARSRNRSLEQVVGSSGGSDGDYVTGVAGDGPTLVYGVISMSYLDTCIEPGEPCEYFVTGGRVMRVVGTRAVRIPNLPPATDVAVSGRRVALLVAAHEATASGPVASGRIEVRDAVTGGLIRSIQLNRTPSDLALGSRAVAVVEEEKGQLPTVTRFSLATGAMTARVPLMRRPSDLSVSGRLVLFRVGRDIDVVEPTRNAFRTVAVATSIPVGLSLEGRRIVWAETHRGGSRIVEAAAG
jgi:hypothetical protein